MSSPQQRIAQLAAHMRTTEVGEETRVTMTHAPTAASGGSGFRVALLGAAGGIGQPLALLLKMSPLVETLHLYDIVNTPGVTCDLSHIDSPCKVRGFVGADSLGAALEGAHLVIVPAGVPRKPGMTRDDLFNTNAGIVRTLAEGIAKHCPRAIVNVISNPVNSTVPIVVEVMKKHGVYDPAKILGVTHLDVVRANTFLAQAVGVDPGTVQVPVIGGHAGVTILPLLSQAMPAFALSEQEVAQLTERIQNGGTEVVEAKAGAGSATLSMAAAALKFGELCLRAMGGAPDIVVCAYVASSLTDAPFFSSRVRLGRHGVEAFLPLGPLTPFERQGLAKAIPELKGNIQKGINFANAA